MLATDKGDSAALEYPAEGDAHPYPRLHSATVARGLRSQLLAPRIEGLLFSLADPLPG